MKIRFACGSCGKAHEVDAANAGRRGKCSRCGSLMTVPSAPAPKPAFDEDEETGDGYGLAEQPEEEPRPAPSSAPASTFVPAGRSREEPSSSFHRATDDASSRPRRTRSKPVDSGDPAEAILRRMPILLGLTGVVMLVLALAVPDGVKYAGGLASGLGLLFSMSTFLVGAYGAFKEDSLYGFLYLIIPLFTAYYIVSRFEDLRNWIYLGLIGLFLSMVGGAMLAAGGG